MCVIGIMQLASHVADFGLVNNGSEIQQLHSLARMLSFPIAHLPPYGCQHQFIQGLSGMSAVGRSCGRASGILA